jgi:hypothetical protein
MVLTCKHRKEYGPTAGPVVRIAAFHLKAAQSGDCWFTVSFPLIFFVHEATKKGEQHRRKSILSEIIILPNLSSSSLI